MHASESSQSFDEKPLVSVIVRTMGRPELATALDSLARQTYPNVEILVVDARGTGALGLNDHCGSHSQRTVSAGKPLLRPAAGNAGLDAARGDYIGFLDEDDYCDANHLETLVTTLQEQPQVRVAYVGLRVYQDESASPAYTLHLEHCHEFLFERNYINLQAVLFHRSLLAAGCRFDESFPILEDWDFALQMAEHTDFLRVLAVTANYRADRGTSGAGSGQNHDAEALLQAKSMLFEKWHSVAKPFRERTRAELEMGRAAQLLGDWDEAERIYRNVLTRNPHDVNALNLAGMARLTRGDSQRAVELLQRAVVIRPDVPGFLHNLGLALDASARQVDTAKGLAGALAMDPQSQRSPNRLGRPTQLKRDLES